jgi:anti-sigma B factor antagonist
MKHIVEKSEGISVIVIQGDLWGGAETCDLQCEIKDEVTEMIARGERQFILDLARTRRINSIGLGVLVAIHASIQNAGGELRFCAVDERPRATFEITGLGNLFQVHETRQDAVGAFTARV